MPATLSSPHESKPVQDLNIMQASLSLPQSVKKWQYKLEGIRVISLHRVFFEILEEMAIMQNLTVGISTYFHFSIHVFINQQPHTSFLGFFSSNNYDTNQLQPPRGTC